MEYGKKCIESPPVPNVELLKSKNALHADERHGIVRDGISIKALAADLRARGNVKKII